jgi:hypothetical protein
MTNKEKAWLFLLILLRLILNSKYTAKCLEFETLFIEMIDA